MASQARDYYRQVKQQVEERSADSKIKEELREFTEKTIHLCHDFQEITRELSRTSELDVVEQAKQLEQRLRSVTDLVARRQYEQALANKKKQLERYQGLHSHAERFRAQVLNYISALENMRFAYTNRKFNSAGDTAEGIEFLMHITDNQADNVYDTSEAYQRLLIQKTPMTLHGLRNRRAL